MPCLRAGRTQSGELPNFLKMRYTLYVVRILNIYCRGEHTWHKKFTLKKHSNSTLSGKMTIHLNHAQLSSLAPQATLPNANYYQPWLTFITIIPFHKAFQLLPLPV